MDNIVVGIQGMSGTDGDYGQLHAFLKGQANTLSGCSPETLMQAVHALDLSQHSLGALFLLEALSRQAAGQAAADLAAFIDLVATFFSSCQGRQIQLAPELFVKLGRKFREQVVAAHCTRKGILPLQAAVRALQPTPEYLTPLHAECFMLCLLSKCYNAACPLLADDIFYVDPSKTTCVPRDLYLYCRYGSLLCIGRKQWARAAELQLMALTAPALAGNAIVMDCYKQYVLVCLISQGSVPPAPKTLSQAVRSLVDSDCRAYTELATAYGTHQPARLARVVEQHQAIFAQDGNLGLLGQVVDSLQPRNIQRLTTTYLTLSLNDIAQQAGLASADAAEQHLLRMVASGDIFASISERDGGMVRFLDDPEAFTSPAASQRLAAAVQASMQLSERLAGTQHALAASKEYLKKVVGKDRSRLDNGEDVVALLAAGASGSTMP